MATSTVERNSTTSRIIELSTQEIDTDISIMKKINSIGRSLNSLKVLEDLRDYGQENKNNPKTIHSILKEIDRIVDQLNNYPDIFNEMVQLGFLKENDIEIHGVNTILVHNCNNKVGVTLLGKANPINRKISESKVLGYRMAMKDNLWNKETSNIKISDKQSGEYIIDGHHRLLALSGLPNDICIDMIFQYNLSKDVEKTIDIGVKRNISHVLTMLGFKNPKVSAAALYYVKQQQSTNLLGRKLGRDKYTRTPIQLDGAELDSFAREHQSIERFIPNNTTYSKPNEVCMISILTASGYILHKINPELSEYFMNKLCSGKGMGIYHPISVLRDRLCAMTSKIEKKRSSTYEQDCFTLIFKTWNYLIHKETINRLQLKKDEMEKGIKPIGIKANQLEWVNTIITNDLNHNVIKKWNNDLNIKKISI